MLIPVHLNTAIEGGERYDTLVSPSGSVAALLEIARKHGHEAVGVDEAFPGKDASREYIERMIGENIRQQRVAVLFSVLGYNAESTVRYMGELRKRFGKELVIAVGGQLIPLVTDAYVNNLDVDAACVGDAEVILPRLARDVAAGTVHKKYEGWLKDAGKGGAFAGMSYDGYFAIRERMRSQRERAGFSQLVVQGPGGPGCSWAANNPEGACNFCALQNITTMNGVSLDEHFANEKDLQERFSPDRFFDVANQFLPHLRKTDVIAWLQQYIDARKRHGVETPKYAYLTVNSIDDQVAGLLKEAGIVEVYIGIDHFDPAVLKTENKPHRAGTVLERCLNALQKYGITFRTGLVLGGGRETEQSLENVGRGVEWMRQQYGDILRSIVIAPMELLPGSRAFREMHKSGACASIFANLFTKGYLTRDEQRELTRTYIEMHSEVEPDQVFALADALMQLKGAIMYSYDDSPGPEALKPKE